MHSTPWLSRPIPQAPHPREDWLSDCQRSPAGKQNTQDWSLRWSLLHSLYFPSSTTGRFSREGFSPQAISRSLRLDSNQPLRPYCHSSSAPRTGTMRPHPGALSRVLQVPLPEPGPDAHDLPAGRASPSAEVPCLLFRRFRSSCILLPGASILPDCVGS